MLAKAKRAFNEGGIAELMRRTCAFVYRRSIRAYLPEGLPAVYSGVATAYNRKWGDEWVPSFLVPREAQDRPLYEDTLVRGLNTHVRMGDRVIVVGGGSGVTSVVAALAAGPTGRVQCFEGSAEMIPLIEKTIARNRMQTRISVHPAVVGPLIEVYGGAPNANQVEPNELPQCDVLELDCEGSELSIIKNLSYRPRVILVETHGLYGSPTEKVSSLLQECGYIVTNMGLAEPTDEEFCSKHDIQILCGIDPNRNAI
jgi:methyltransferase FkbM-like protein